MSEQDTIIEDNAVSALEGEEQVNEAPDYSEMDDVDTLREELLKRDEEVAKSKKSYDEYRSMTDRKSNETAERLAKLEGRLEERQVQPEAPTVDTSEIFKEMKAKVEEDPANLVDYFQDAIREMQDVMEEKSQSINANLESRISKQSPVYQANKEFVDWAVEAGASFGEALSQAEKMFGDKVSAPGTPKAPGVVEASRTTTTREAVPKIEVSAHDMKVMRDCGLDEKAIQDVIKNASKDMVSA